MTTKLLLPKAVEQIIARLNQAGQEAYAVGGCVRDSLLGRSPADWDFCTSALPEQVKECFSGCTVLETGLKHGTVTVKLDGNFFEITTFRTESGYTDGRHPDRVAFVRSLPEDLSRRDFTINAMAYHPTLGLQDFFGGLEDLRAGQIRCVGTPALRFQEDALRLMRAVRFGAVYGFEIEETTARAIHQERRRIRMVSAERIQSELCKLLAGQGCEQMLRDYRDLFGEVIPELIPMFGLDQKNPYHCYDLWEHTLHSVGAVPGEPPVRLAMLLHDIGKPRCFTQDSQGVGHFYGHGEMGAEMAHEILSRLRFDKNRIRLVETLVRYHDSVIPPQPKAVRRWLGKLGEESFRLWLLVKRADLAAQAPGLWEERSAGLDRLEEVFHQVLAEGQCFSRKSLAVTGRDLIESGFSAGPELGRMLERLLSLVVEGELPNEKEVLLAWARKERL